MYLKIINQTKNKYFLIKIQFKVFKYVQTDHLSKVYDTV